jgi:GNAT superfamily N-acetyltransferase
LVSLSVRRATLQDVPLLLELIRGLAEYEKLLHEVTATEELLRDHLFGARPAASALIGEVDGRPEGYTVYFRRYSTFSGRPGIYLEDIFVRPETRGSGLGKALMAELCRLVLEDGGDHMEWAVLDWNEPSIGFYRSLGAKAETEWPTYSLEGEALRALAATAANYPL